MLSCFISILSSCSLTEFFVVKTLKFNSYKLGICFVIRFSEYVQNGGLLQFKSGRNRRIDKNYANNLSLMLSETNLRKNGKL